MLVLAMKSAQDLLGGVCSEAVLAGMLDLNARHIRHL